LLQISDEAERHRLCEIILNGEEAEIGQLIDRAIEAGALKFAIATGRRMVREAQEQLRIVPANKYRDALSGLCTTLDEMILRLVH
jgi:geranylgeranyl pyrophosphate synthase